jgi:hypothetical protein
MDEQLCLLTNYLYRRVPIPTSVQWHMNWHKISVSPAMRVPGFVDQEGGANQCSINFAIPCSTSGEIDPETQAEYEDLADERFSRLCPGQKLV